jgi:hypothetical protein
LIETDAGCAGVGQLRSMEMPFEVVMARRSRAGLRTARCRGRESNPHVRERNGRF